MTKKTTETTKKTRTKGSTKAPSTKKKGQATQEARQEPSAPARRVGRRHPSFTPAQLYPATISEEELTALPIAKCPVPLHVIDTKIDARKAVAKIRKSMVIGIDTETRPSFKAGVRYEVSLLQIATEEECYLFRLNLIGLTKSLISLLEDPDILKVGLSLKDDLSALARRHSFAPASFVELQRLCGGYGIRELSLLKIYAIIFAERMSKAQRMSNWESSTLSPAQIHYAALDAWASLRIYLTLLASPAPSPTNFALP